MRSSSDDLFIFEYHASMGIKAAAGETYTIRRKILVLFGASFQIFDAEGTQIGYCRQKAFKLKEDLRICTDDSMTEEMMRIRARSVIDFAATYDVTLPESQGAGTLGSLRRRGMKSLVRDSWVIFDASGREIAKLQEDSVTAALFRRFFGSMFFPQKFEITTPDGRKIATLRQHFNWFVYRFGIAIHESDELIDDLVILAAGCLIAAVEGRQGGGSGGSILDILTP